MTKSKNTKRALLASTMSLLLCFAMLIGSTFAWFTDSVSTGVNKIVAGNLDVELYYKNATGGYQNVKAVEEDTNPFFRDKDGNEIKWEPGVMAYTYFKVSNEGSLALKYKLTALASAFNTVADTDYSLKDVIKFAVIENDTTVPTRESIATIEEWGAIETFAAEDTLTPKGTDTAEKAFTVIAYWAPGASDNNYNLNNGKTTSDGADELYIDLGITLLATQTPHESDSFDENYDEYATYPPVPVFTGKDKQNGIITKDSGTAFEFFPIQNQYKTTQLAVLPGTFDVGSKVELTVDTKEVRANSVLYNIGLNLDGSPIQEELNNPVRVKINLGAGLTDVKVTHNDNPMTKVDYQWDLDNGTYLFDSSGNLTICTSSFSPFEVTYNYDFAASIDGKGYATLEKAVSAAKAGDTIVVAKDLSFTKALTFSTENVTLDLNQKTLKSSSADFALKIYGSGCKIKNGTIISSELYGIRLDNGIETTLDSLVIDAASYCVVANGSNKVTIQSSTLTGSMGVGIWGSDNDVTVKNCQINSNSFGIYHNGSNGPSTVTVQNSTIVDESGTGIYISGNATISPQNLIVENCNVTAPTAIEVKHTNATVKDSVLTATETEQGAVIAPSGSCTTGYSFAATSNGVTDYVRGNSELINCELRNSNGEAGKIFVFTVANDSSVSIDGNVVTDYDKYDNQ